MQYTQTDRHTHTTTQQIIIQLNVSFLLYQRKCKFQGSKKFPVVWMRVKCVCILIHTQKLKRTIHFENRSRI